MKKLLLLLFLICSTYAFGQIKTTTSKKGYLVYDYNGDSFDSNKKIKEGEFITILRRFKEIKGFYVVSYKGKDYCLARANINNEGVYEFEKLESDSIQRIRNREDSICQVIMAKEALINKRRADSIANIQRIKDSIRQAEAFKEKQELDSIKLLKIKQASIILKRYSDEKEALVKAGMPIEIEYLSASDPNSAGGSDLEFKFKNISSKTIKYISVTGYPINPVKDKCYCSIRRYSQTTRKGVGPIESGEFAEYTWDTVWYNHTIDKYIPTSINIQYMNGSSINITGEKLKKIMQAPLLDKVYDEILKDYEIDLDELMKDVNLYELPNK